MRGRIDLNLPRPDVAHPTASFRRYRVREATTCALFLTPALLFLAVSSFYPLLYSLYLSFHDWNMTIPFSRPYFVGADGYLRLVRDSDFHRSFLRTLDFVGSAVSIELVLGLGVAVLITSRLPIIGVARTVFLFP